ncbi:MAG: YqjK family protein [Burkholderiales bacterium]|nr:YqjK-like family protein [Sulfuricellaceae bacterium]
MNERLIKIRKRRAGLVVKAGLQREAVADALAQWKRPVALIDGGVAVLRNLRAHPVLVGGVVAAAVVAGRKNIHLGKWLARGLSAWRFIASGGAGWLGR